MIIYNGVHIVNCIQYIKISIKGGAKVILILAMLRRILTLKQNVGIYNKIISIKSINRKKKEINQFNFDYVFA